MSAWKNPPLLMAIALPAVAVLASFATLGITLANPDSQLPEQYHWEGFQLDRDFSRAEQATALGIRATLRHFGGVGSCEVDLHTRGVVPETLNLTLAHATRSDWDQHLQLRRSTTGHDARGATASYGALCKAISQGHWRLELTDGAHTWSVRSTVHGELTGFQLDATHAEDD